jgi:hypothetical protein
LDVEWGVQLEFLLVDKLDDKSEALLELKLGLLLVQMLELIHPIVFSRQVVQVGKIIRLLASIHPIVFSR